MTRLKLTWIYRLIVHSGAASVIAFLCVCPASALDPTRAFTQYMQTNWTNEDGLPQNSVHAIAQTADGFIWLGTEEGLARFDGVQFEVFNRKNTPELASDYIQSLMAARDGGLWIGTDSGLTYLAPPTGVEAASPGHAAARFRRFTAQDGLASDNITVLCEDRDGAVWVGTTRGLTRMRSGHAEKLSGSESLAGVLIRAIVRDAHQRLWIGTDDGLIHFDHGKMVKWTTRDGLPGNSVMSLAATPEGSVWIGTLNHGLAEIVDDRVVVSHTVMPANEIDALFADSDGALWIAFDRAGIGRLYRGKLDLYNQRKGLPSDRCTRAIFVDREGSLWAGFLDAGVVEIRSGKFSVYGKPEGLAGNYTGNILQSRDGSMWIGSDSNGLNHLLPDGRIEVWNRRQGLPNEAIYSVVETKDRSIWIGYRLGALARIHNGKVSVYKDLQARESSLASLFEDRDGTLWAGFFGKGLARFTAGRFDHVSDTGSVVALAQTADGAVWAGTDGAGIVRMLGGTTTHYSTAQGLPSDHVMCLYADQKSDLWIGTAGGGLSRIRNGQIVSWTSEQGLPDTTVGTIVEGNDGKLWMGGDNGVFSVSKMELNESATKPSRSIHARLYGTADGLRSRETLYGSTPSAWKDQSGRIWFATIMGAAVVDPAHIENNAVIPPVWIQSAAFDAHPFTVKDGISLGPGSGNLAVSFTAPSFVAPKQMRFRYRLIGFDREWNEAGSRREAWYTNLPPGTYTFVAQAANSDGVWNETGASFHFVLSPPLSRTPLAYFCYGIAVLCIAWLVTYLRTRRLVRGQLELTRIVAERTAQLEFEKKELMSARKELQFRATHDPLTGLMNRGAIMERLAHEVERAHREQSTITIALGDLDFFKQINDTKGHLCGDQVLTEAGQRLQAQVRRYDSIGRYGGEEFLILLPGYDALANPEHALALVNAFGATPFEFQTHVFYVSCSFGVVVVQPAAVPVSLEQLLSLADEMLYRAKRAGRNRAEIVAYPRADGPIGQNEAAQFESNQSGTARP